MNPSRNTSNARNDRSGSPTRGRDKPPPCGRSGSPSSRAARGRSGSPSRKTVVRGKSGSPSRTIAARGKSGSPSRMAARGRSMSPSRMARARSASPSRNARGRSASPSRMAGGGVPGPGGKPLRKGRKGPMKRIRNTVRRGKRPTRDGGSDAPLDRRGNWGSQHGKSIRDVYHRSVRRMTEADSCTGWKIACYLVPITLLLASIVGLIVATGNASKITPDALRKKLNNEDLEDPRAGEKVPVWNNNGVGGLELDVVNALDDSWQVMFALATADWEFGNPDSLTLTTEQVAHEIECDPVDGKVKVCNGDYGDLKWRGINQAVLDKDGFITACAARMNDFYLANEQDDAKQYTMCHEVGHSFGLPHSDEDFDNIDLGNCMDYTNNFDVNKHPDETNYEHLLELYGSSGGRRLRQGHSFKSTVREMPEALRRKMKEAVSKLDQRRDDRAHEDGWRLLHRAKHGEAHELELGEGYKVQVEMLLA